MTKGENRFYAFCCLSIFVLPQIRAFTSTPLQNPGCKPVFNSRGNAESKTRRLFGTFTNNQEISASGGTILEPYEYDGWKLTYRKIAENESEADTNEDYHNVLLIHPVGVGLASWFWEPLMTALEEKKNKSNSKIRAYAPNLIGCGISEGSQSWDPDQRGMFVPLGWVKGCEALVNQINDDSSSKPRKWTVVTQGGLAPIGVLLAARNPDLVETLVLTSPPTWKDMTNAVPQTELERNYNFLRSPFLGKLAFALLETRGLVEFFSNQFLFSKECDDAWLDQTELEMCEAARPPIQNFNAGMCLNRSLERELLEEIQSKVVVIQGENDKRLRQEYTTNMENCELVSIKGTMNVVPWEDPGAVADLLLQRIAAATTA